MNQSEFSWIRVLLPLVAWEGDLSQNDWAAQHHDISKAQALDCSEIKLNKIIDRTQQSKTYC